MNFTWPDFSNVRWPWSTTPEQQQTEVVQNQSGMSVEGGRKRKTRRSTKKSRKSKPLKPLKPLKPRRK